jgi:ribonuclease P protein component
MADHRFLRAYRITRGADFQRAYQRRLTAGDDRLLVFVHNNGLSYPRLGLSVSRKVGGAVVRNRWKRCIREAFRLSREDLPCGIDLLVIPRPDVVPSMKELQESLIKLARRAAKRL